MTNLLSRRTLSLALAVAMIGGSAIAITTLPAQAFSVSVAGGEGNEAGEHQGAKHNEKAEGSENEACAAAKLAECDGAE